jgi:hypothetical protein
VPIGAALVSAEGTILGQGHNLRIQKGSATLHVCEASLQPKLFAASTAGSRVAAWPDTGSRRQRYQPWKMPDGYRLPPTAVPQCTPPSHPVICAPVLASCTV